MKSHVALDFKRVANADVGEPETQALLFSFMKKINILALSVIAAQRHIPHSVAAGDKKGRKLLDAKPTERASFLC